MCDLRVPGKHIVPDYNADYPLLEIILLNYNSQDDMEEWVKTHLAAYIESGKVMYYKTRQPKVFNHSHSKNMAFRLATGDIVCNINADVFVGTGFATYVNACFRENNNIFVHPKPGPEFDPGTAGVVCVSKSNFQKVGGFDERMLIYGWEDSDFNKRLEFAGTERVTVVDTAFLKAINHTEKYDRIKLLLKIEAIYIDQEDPLGQEISKVFILFKDNRYKYGTIINNLIKHALHPGPLEKNWHAFDLEEKIWEEGSWEENDGGITFISQPGNISYCLRKQIVNRKTVLQQTTAGPIFHMITDPHIFDRVVYFEMDYSNRQVMIENEVKERIEVNDGHFGKGIVFCNFDYKTSIKLE